MALIFLLFRPQGLLVKKLLKGLSLMIYKETGQYKSSYKSDHAIFPLIQDKIAFGTLMIFAFLVVPFLLIAIGKKLF